MLIWFLAILCFGLLGSGGQVQGGIKMSISLVGLLLATLLAVPLGPLLKPVLPLLGLGHPVWSWCVPPVIVFILIVLAFASLAQYVGHKVWVWYAYKAADDDRLFWERLNRRLGICVGVILGSLYLILIGLLIYVMGYFTVQVKTETGVPFMVRMINSATSDLKGTGLEKIVNSINPVPQSYYDAADAVGLLFQNPDLRQRLADYPLFLTLSERPDIQAMLNDQEFMALAKSPTNNFVSMLNHPTFKGLVNNKELLEIAKQVDPKDLLDFLKTGKSVKYEPEKIVGRWEIDQIGTLNAIRKKSTRTVTELKYLQGVMRVLMTDISFVAGGNNQVLLKGSTRDAAQIVSILSYKLPPNTQPPPLPLRAPPPVPPATNNFKLLASGTWKKDGDAYILTTDGNEAPASVTDSRLTVAVGGQPVVFIRVD